MFSIDSENHRYSVPVLRSVLFGGHKSIAVVMGNRGRLDYCIFGLQAAIDTQFVMVDTACGKHHDQQNV